MRERARRLGFSPYPEALLPNSGAGDLAVGEEARYCPSQEEEGDRRVESPPGSGQQEPGQAQAGCENEPPGGKPAGPGREGQDPSPEEVQ